MCVELALKKRFLCFCRVAGSCAWHSCVFRLKRVRCLVSGAPIVICISGNFCLRIKTQLARRLANSAGEVHVRQLCTRAQRKRQSEEPCGAELVEAGSRSGRRLRGQRTGVDGLLPGQVPNSTSARGRLPSIHLYLPLRGALVANPPTSIRLLMSSSI